MRRYVSRVLLGGALAVSAVGCAGAGGPVTFEGGSEGGRYLVLVPELAGPSGGDVADQLRTLIADMATHSSVSERDMRRAMAQYDLESLNEVTARQLAQQINVQNVLWGEVQQGGSGLQADVTFIDVASGDEITIDDVSGGSADALAQAIFSRVEQSVEGIRQAAFCNDYLSSQQFDRALETCDRALAIVPNSTSALYGRATALLNLERPEEALQSYAQLLEVDPAHQDALLGAGLAASQLERSEEALGYYTRYMEVNPGNVQVRMTVANRIAQTGDYASAYRILEPAVADNADNVDFQKYLFSIATAAGQRVAEQQDDQAARPFFEAAMNAYTASYGTGTVDLDASALRQAVAVNNALGNRDQALQLAQQATTQFDTVAAVWSQYATVLRDAGRHAEAAQALTRVAEIDPDYENVYIRRAQAYMEADNRQAALADLERAAQRGNRENVARVIFSMANRPLQANQFGEAAQLLSMAQNYATGTMRSDINFFLGYSYYKQGESIAKANTQGRAADAQRALDFFQRALPLVQQSSHANAPQVASAAQQYIENQQAIIQAAQRGR